MDGAEENFGGGLVSSMGVNRDSTTVAGMCARAAGDTNEREQDQV